MKKKMVMILLAGTLGFSLAGCSSTSSKDTKQEAANEEAPDETAGFEENTAGQGDEAPDETELSVDPIVPSDYLIKDASDYVTLGDYSGIAAERIVYEITDDMVQDRINEELDMYSLETEADEPAQEGDTVYMNLSYTVEGTDETYDEEDYFIVLGDEEYGAEFDEKLTGVSAGDTAEFSITYGEDDDREDLAGSTVDFKVEVTGVYRLDVPEYNDDFVTNTVGFTSKEEYEAVLRQQLTDEYEQMSYSDAADTIFEEAVARTQFNGYPQEVYDACEEKVLSFYYLFSGATTREEVCEQFEFTDDELEEEILDEVNLRLLASAYCLEKGVDVTQEEYMNYLSQNALDYGETPAEYESETGRETIVWELYAEKLKQALYEEADVTEVPYDESEFEDDTEVYFEEDTELN